MHFKNVIAVFLLLGLVACSQKPVTSTLPFPTSTIPTSPQTTSGALKSTPTATELPVASRLLTICLGREPASLFYYDATSTSARDVLAAIYDGPVDVQDYAVHPVILEGLPSLENGDARLQSVQVNTGDLIVDSSGNPVNLEAGVEYRPSGCTAITCTQSYTGDQPITMDKLVLDFKLVDGIQWSDGTPLLSADSLYSFELARSIYPAAQPELILRTQSYQAINDKSVEWTGIPGYQDGNYQSKFFTPLPQHAWHTYSVTDLRSAEISSRLPIGWGAYVIDQWVPGDHISLHKNPLYFRAAEGLPRFDNLVYRFVGSTDEALDALQAGECDLVDQTAVLDPQSSRLAEMQSNGKVQTFALKDAGWEQITFGINPLDSQRNKYFQQPEVRQAVALCIDRQALPGIGSVEPQQGLASYVSPNNPLYNPDVEQFTYDVQKAASLLSSAGWQDEDNNPATPRISRGVSGVPDGTPFEVGYWVTSDAGPQADALKIQAMLQECGISTKITALPSTQFLAPGPDGPVFGRSFDLAQFAWAGSLEPACYLYLTSEIPGPYPEFVKGWGGVNASGFTNPEFDQACENALFSLPDAPQHRAEHLLAQEIFAAELPALPLYLHFNVSVARPDLCNFTSVSAVDTPLWYLEQLDYGGGCSQ